MNRKMYTINVATNARKGPSTKSDIITVVMPGTVLDVIDEAYYDNEGKLLEEPWYLTKYGWMADVDGNALDGDVLGNCSLIVDNKRYDYRFSVLADPYNLNGESTLYPPSYFKDLAAEKEGYHCAFMTNGALFYTYDGLNYSNGLEVSQGVVNQDLSMTAVSDYLNCGAIYSDVDDKDKPLFIGRYEEWMNALIPGHIQNALSGILIRKDGQTIYDNKPKYEAQWNSSSNRTIWYETVGRDGERYIGTIMMMSVTVDEAIRVCECLGIDAAIVMDGGGSCFRKICGDWDVEASRKVKSAMALYYKEKSPEPEPEPEPSDLEKRVTSLEEEVKDIKMRLDKLEPVVDALDIDVTKLYETMKDLHHTLEGY